MGLLQSAAAEVETLWSDAEQVVEADVGVIANGVKSFLSAATPSLWSTLLTLGEDVVADVVSDPANWVTAFLNQASAAAIAEWNVLEPKAQSAIASVVAGIKAIGTTPPAAAAPAPAAQ